MPDSGVTTLWQKSGGQRGKFLELMREAGHVAQPGDEGPESALPCGWAPGRRDNKYTSAVYSTALGSIYHGYRDIPVLKNLLFGATNLVMGCGSWRPKAVIVGEGPGATEDRMEKPFCGPSGQLLDKTLERYGESRENFWVTNVMKYRCQDGGHDRSPSDREISASLPFLFKEIALIGGPNRAPGCRTILALGRSAASAILGEPVPVATRHGSFSRISVLRQKGWRVFVSFHPAAALRSGQTRQAFIEDLGKFAALLTAQEENRAAFLAATAEPPGGMDPVTGRAPEDDWG